MKNIAGRGYALLFFLGAIILVSGCAWFQSAGYLKKIRLDPTSEELAFLVDRWEEFHVYYTGPRKENPSAVLFDPRGDELTVIAEGWMAVKDREVLEVVMDALASNPRFPPSLYKLLGPEGKEYGYIYTAVFHVYTRKIAPATLWVEDIPTPPFIVVKTGRP